MSKVLENATLRIYHSNLKLAELRNKVDDLKNKTATLKTNTTQLQESNVEGTVSHVSYLCSFNLHISVVLLGFKYMRCYLIQIFNQN